MSRLRLLPLSPWPPGSRGRPPAPLSSRDRKPGPPGHRRVDEARGADPEPPATTPDWKGIRRDTWYFLGYQFVAVGVLYALPEEVTQFEREGDYLRKWRTNVSNPARDADDHYINYVLHPYWGAAYYIRARERGLTRWESFGYSVLLSTLFEYGAEALFEKPSYQDLVVTPLVGSLLGEYVFAPLRRSIKSRPGATDGLGRFVLVLTDPLGAANDLTNRLFGAETHVSLAPMRTMRPRPVFDVRPAGNAVAGPWPEGVRSRAVTWGLQLDVRW